MLKYKTCNCCYDHWLEGVGFKLIDQLMNFDHVPKYVFKPKNLS